MIPRNLNNDLEWVSFYNLPHQLHLAKPSPGHFCAQLFGGVAVTVNEFDFLVDVEEVKGGVALVQKPGGA